MCAFKRMSSARVTNSLYVFVIVVLAHASCPFHFQSAGQRPSTLSQTIVRTGKLRHAVRWSFCMP